MNDNLKVLISKKSRFIELQHVLKNLNLVFQEVRDDNDDAGSDDDDDVEDIIKF